MLNNRRKLASRFGILSILLIFVGTLLVSLSLLTRRTKFLVKDVHANGMLELADTRKIKLSGIKIPNKGDDDHEAVIFLLTQMTKDVEIWLEEQGGEYKVWIGCKDHLWTKDCKSGVLLNDELVKAGVATKNK